MSLYERQLVPIFLEYEYNELVFRNLNAINGYYLPNGWEVERVDELHDSEKTSLMYILRKEKEVKE